MLLRVMYNHEAFSERDVVRLLVMVRVEEKVALGFASTAMPVLNQLAPWCRKDATVNSISL
jgi:hypothetical protein